MSRKCGALIVLVACLISFVGSAAGEWTVDTNSNYEKLGNILHSFPHFTFSGGVASSSDVQFSASKDYAESIAMLGVPFVVVAILVLLVGLASTCCICLCLCKKSTPSSFPRIIVKCLRLLLAVVVLGCCAGGIYGAFAIHESIPYVIDKADDSGSLIINRAEVVYGDLLKVQEFIPDISQISSLLNTAHTYEKDLQDLSGPAKDLELVEFILTLTLYGIICFVTVLSMLAGCLRWGKCLLGVSFLGWIGLIIIWVVCGIYLSGSVATADFCETQTSHLLNEFLSSAALESNIVAHFVLCNGSQILQQLESDALGLIILSSQKLSEAEKSGNKTAIAYWQGVYNNSLALERDFLILVNCTDTYNNVNDSKEKVCTEFMVGAFIIMTSLFFVGVLGFLVWILGIIEWKLEDLSCEEDDDYVTIGDERTPLVEINSSEPRYRRRRFN